MVDSLLLCHSTAKTRRLVSHLRAGRKSVKWMFLCQDYLRLLEWQNAVGSLADHIEIGGALNQVAGELRQPFLDLITELGRRHNSIAWWASRLSERNTMVSPLFLYCCYLKVAQQALESTSGTLCVISESWEVLESLAELARERGCRVAWVRRPVPGSRHLEFLTRTAKRLGWFVASSIGQRRRDSGAFPGKGDQPGVLIRTWVDEACFGAEGVFKDRYFPGLCQWLTAQGYAVRTTPVLLNLDRSYRSAWEWLRNSEQQFLNPFRYYRLSDYLFALRGGCRQVNLTTGPVHLNEINVGRLFAAEQKRAAFDVSSLESILSFRLPRRLAEHGYGPDILVDAFENMIPDKLFILGFRRYLPQTKLVGFQHGALYPLLLCLFVTRGESEFAPMPDRVVCNGEFFRDILVREGLPADRTAVGAALRYAHLWAAGKTTQPFTQPTILVPLPLVPDAAVELLTKVVSALEPVRDVEILVKAHPMSSLESLLSAAQLRELPPQFKFVQGTMGDLIKRSRVVIALSSNTVHEALAAGVPVVVVGREAALDLNPLDWYPDLNKVVRSPEKLREQVLTLLQATPKDLDDYRQRAQEVLHSCFSPITNDAMQAFVKGLVEFPVSQITRPQVYGGKALAQAKR